MALKSFLLAEKKEIISFPEKKNLNNPNKVYGKYHMWIQQIQILLFFKP
jgi:hypothetical protein